MLEIIILYKLAKRIGTIVVEKGHPKGRYQVMLVALWFGGEILGAFFGGFIGAIVMESEETIRLFAYVFALTCAIIGAVSAFQIVKQLETVHGEQVALDLQRADLERWNERSSPNDPSLRIPDDGYTERPDKTQRPLDDRIQN